jgi:hypothetical protein
MAKFSDADRTNVKCCNCGWQGIWWVNHKCPKCKSPDLKTIGAPLYTMPKATAGEVASTTQCAPEPTGQRPFLTTEELAKEKSPFGSEPKSRTFTPASEVFAKYDDEGKPRKKRKKKRNYGGSDPGI